jgi:hypothetical protein
MSSYNVSKTQSAGELPVGLKHEFITVNSITAPSFGSNFTIRATEKGFIQDCTICFNVGAVSGYTGTAVNVAPRFSPTPFWIQKCEIVQSGEVLQTIYPDAQWIRQQLFTKEDDRQVLNASSGIYSSQANRYSMAITTSNYFLPLRSLFNETYLPILTESHAVEFRIWLNPVAQLITTTGLTVTTIAAAINSASVILKMTKLPSDALQREIQTIAKIPKHLRFHESRYVNGVALSGTSSYTLPLTNIVGKVSNFFFVVRPTTGLTLDATFSYSDILNFAILDGGSTNVVGGQSITSLYNRTIMSQHWNRSFYMLDAFNGTSNSFVFQYSWSHNPFDATNNGKSQSFRQFMGSEVLQINWSSALGANMDITAFAMTQAYVELTPTSSKRIYA